MSKHPFLDPDVRDQFLDAETDTMGKRNFMKHAEVTLRRTIRNDLKCSSDTKNQVRR